MKALLLAELRARLERANSVELGIRALTIVATAIRSILQLSLWEPTFGSETNPVCLQIGCRLRIAGIPDVAKQSSK